MLNLRIVHQAVQSYLRDGPTAPTQSDLERPSVVYLFGQLHRCDAAETMADLIRGATEPDKLAWIRSHALRKTTAIAIADAGHTARQIADQLGQVKVSITQDINMWLAANLPIRPPPWSEPSRTQASCDATRAA